ncbi:MAG: response regulator [Sphaerochaeta sp.]
MKVVVADDERRVCALICALIDWDGLALQNVGTAYDGLEALEVIKKERPDLVITDIRMPGLNGLELISKAKALQPDVQFIIISGHKQFDYAQSAIKYGVAEYLLKPIKKQELNQTLQRMKKRYSEQTSSKALQKQVHEDREYLKRTSFLAFLKSQDPQLLFPWIPEKALLRIAVIGIQSPSKDPVIQLLQQKVSTALERDSLNVCLQAYQGDLYLLYTYEGEQRSQVVLQGERLVELLTVQAQIFPELRSSVALGLEVSCIEHLPQSLNSAKQALVRRLVEGHHRLFEAVALENPNLESYLYNIASSFEQCCAQENLDTEQLASDVFCTLEKQQVSLYTTVEVLLQSYRQALQFAKQQCTQSNVIENQEQAMLESSSLEALQEAYRKAMQSLLVQYREEREVQVSKPIRSSVGYLQEHYKDEMLSLELVSEQVHLNSSYFSALFKKSMGLGFSEYVLALRIQEAKRLLVETNKGIAEIALEIGYHDPKHFTKLFKKSCQIKPNEYRKLYG